MLDTPHQQSHTAGSLRSSNTPDINIIASSTPRNEYSHKNSPVLSETLSAFETQPLLSSHFETRQPGVSESQSEGDSDGYGSQDYSDSDCQSKYTELVTDKIVKFSKRRFWWFCGIGVIAIIILQLSFLPRTSLSRDYRRWNGLHLTKTDVKRSYLLYSETNAFQEYTNEQQIDWILLNLTTLNKKNAFNLVSDDNIKLTKFIEDKFKQYRFKTQLHTREVELAGLKKPHSASVKLYDTKGKLVYTANTLDLNFKTPNYFGFGFNGTSTGKFIFVNLGLQEDYDVLSDNGFVVEGKVVIIKSNFKSNLTISHKVSLAESHGAIGVVHYTDYSSIVTPTSKTFNSLVQRDTVARDYFGLSDVKEPKIPAIPMSLKTIQPILNTLISEGKRIEGWGYYPETKNFNIEVSAHFDSSDTRKATNIIGTLDGIIKDGIIVIGAARDSFDSNNPLSNQAILLEIMRHFHQLVKLGWKPLRTIQFISFDAARNGLIGSQAYLEDKIYKLNILTYINIEQDAVRGSGFGIDSNPLLAHTLKKVSKLISFPKDFGPFKKLPKLGEIDSDPYDDDNDNDDDDDDDNIYDNTTTLHKYWKLQNNNSINHKLGTKISGTDSFPFQYHGSTPVVNVKFNNAKWDSSSYIPNANYYSYKWLSNIDENWVLHSLLIRYLGMLLISLSEHEVVDFKVHDYLSFIREEVEEILANNAEVLLDWQDEDIIGYIDLPLFNFYGDEDEISTMYNLTTKLHDVSKTLTTLSVLFDKYNEEVQDGLTQDYPWYQYLKKIKLWAQFKVSNYKLLHLDKELSQKPDSSTARNPWFNHLVYDGVNSTFTKLQTALESENIKDSAKHMFELYEKFKGLDKKMT